MSYILDALKKSEQERGHGTAPGVQTLHSSGLNYHSNKSQLWPYFLLAAVVINLAALLFFMMTKTGAETAGHEQTVSMASDPVVLEARRTPARGEPVTAVKEAGQTETTVYKQVTMPEPGRPVVNTTQNRVEIETASLVQPANSIVEMDELPMDVLQYIPVMKFSAHVYSTNPLQRSMVVNGRFMEEGDRLNSDLYLAEITPDGAIFNYQGQLFHQRIVSTWN